MICIIPARGGSKRLPGKNIKQFFGVPIIYHAINTAKESGIFSEVIVSTDDNLIRDVCKQIGTKVDMRPEGLRGDVSESDVLYEIALRKGSVNVCRIYPFSALLSVDDLMLAYRLYMMYNRTSTPVTVMQVTKYEHSPVRAMKIDESGFIEYHQPEDIMLPTQELSTYYHDAASYLFTKREELLKPLDKRLLFGIPAGVMGCQDVDTAEDFEMLKMKYALRNRYEH